MKPEIAQIGNLQNVLKIEKFKILRWKNWVSDCIDFIPNLLEAGRKLEGDMKLKNVVLKLCYNLRDARTAFLNG